MEGEASYLGGGGGGTATIKRAGGGKKKGTQTKARVRLSAHGLGFWGFVELFFAWS
jgi:hypothetical protein